MCMKRCVLVMVCCVAVLMLCAQEAADPVLLTVNGIPVNRSEFVNSYHHNIKGDVEDRISPSDYLDRFIDYKLKLAAAQAAGYQLPTSSDGRTVTASSTVNVADREAVYQRACLSAGSQDMLCLAQILLSVDSRATAAGVEKVRQRIDSVYQALSQGADFSEMACRLSDDATAASGGMMGWVGPTQLLETVEREAYALRSGETSRPFLSVAGWHIVKVLDRRPATSDEVRQWFLSEAAPQQLAVSMSAGDALLLKEYQEGLLISRMTQETVYEQPLPEEKKLKRYFKKNKKRYGRKLKKRDFPRFRDLVLADYRLQQEQEWVVSLRRQYKVRVDKNILKTIE